jgi:hypothetical protein
VFAILLMSFAPGATSIAAEMRDPVGEYQIKAAFLFNFARFVEWPAGAFQTPNEPISICVLGQDPFGTSLDEAVARHNAEGRALVIRHLAGIKPNTGCHIIFIASSEVRHGPSLLSKLAETGVLTVGDSDATGRVVPYGAVISFVLEDQKVRFEVDVDAADRQKLKISSRLLSLAKITRSAGK